MKKYMTEKDRAEQAEVLRITMLVAKMAGLELDTKVSILPPQYARYLIAHESEVILIPSTPAEDDDRDKIEVVMRMTLCDAVVVNLAPTNDGRRKPVFEIAFYGSALRWYSDYGSRLVDGELFFTPRSDADGPLFKLTQKGLQSSIDFAGMRHPKF